MYVYIKHMYICLFIYTPNWRIIMEIYRLKTKYAYANHKARSHLHI